MKKIILSLCLIVFLTVWASILFAQDKIALPPDYQVDTRIDNMGYWRKCAELGLVPVAPFTKVPAAQYTGSKVFLDGFLLDDSPDVPVTTDNTTTQSENSIAVDPENKAHVLNSNNSTPNPSTGSVYGTSWYYTLDEGGSWSGSKQGAGGSNSGDPAACINISGRYFIGFIDNGLGQSVSYSDNNGTTWTVVKVANGSMSNILDKNHLWVDIGPSSPYQGHLYNGWMSYDQIYVSRSITNGTSWSSPVAISQGTSAGSHNQGLNFKTGPDGEVYCVWSVYDSWPSDEKALGFAKSLDGGITWQPATRILNNIKGIRTSGTGKNMRVNSFPCMAVDLSNGPYHGTIYVVFSNKGYPGINTGNDIDCYMIKSSDEGATWSAPLKINQNASGQGKQSYFPWIACDQASGQLSVVFYDDRNVTSNKCEVFMAWSTNGGTTWQDMKVSDVSFTPTPIPALASQYMGDYLGISSYNGKTYPCWTDNRLGYCMTFVSPINMIIPAAKVVYDHDYLNDTTYGNSNNKMDNGEVELLGLRLKNSGNAAADSITVTLSSESPFITIIDSTKYFGDFEVNQKKTILNAFKFETSLSMPGGSMIPFLVKSKDARDSVTISTFSIPSHAPAVKILDLTISDPLGNNNGRLDPGETANISILTKNPGEDDAVNVISELTSTNPYVTISNGTYTVGTLAPGQEAWASFTVTVSPYAYIGSAASFHNYAHSEYHSDNKDFLLKIGLIVEDWETGNFNKFAWTFYGDSDWTIDPNVKYEKLYSARSGSISDNQTTGLQINYNVMIDDSISFYRKVSSQPLGDRLNFYIDNLFIGQWSGFQDWKRLAYPVMAGPHTFKWEYVKNSQTSTGTDAAWVDFIVFPPEFKLTAHAGGNGSSCGNAPYQLHGLAMNYDSLLWTTSGTGTFTDPWILNAIYNPSQQDVTAGSVLLTIQAYGPGQTDTADSMTLTFVSPPSVSSGGNKEICKGSTIALNSASAANYNSIQWFTSGDGTFDNNANLNPVYTPGQQDILQGTVQLKLAATGTLTSCPIAYDSLQLTIFPVPVINLGNDTSICAGRTLTLDATVPNAASYLWYPSGKTVPVINVDSTGIGIGTQLYGVAVTDANECTGYDTINVTYKDCTGIEEMKGVTLRIYPNPNPGLFTLEINTIKNQKLNILVLNASGEPVYTLSDIDVSGSFTRKIDLTNLPQGSYLFELFKGNEILVRKLVIQK